MPKMTAVQSYVYRQLKNGKEITSELLDKLITDHAPIATKLIEKYERYTGENVPILKRELPNSTKINNRLLNDFIGEVVDTKSGFMFGNPISYQLNKNKYITEEKPKNLLQKMWEKVTLSKSDTYKNHSTVIEEFTTRNNSNDIDSEWGKMASICGYAGREVFVDLEGNERVVNLPPWEVIFLTNESNEVEYALRYYKLMNVDDTYYTRIEWFDSLHTSFFVENTDKDGDKYILDAEEVVNPKPHEFFDYCPIILLMNNEEMQGDCDKVITLLDSYDNTLSDVSSEITQFRLAYMYFKGEKPNEDTIKAAQQTGGFWVGQDGQVGFITKNINDAVVEHHLDRLENNIKRFTKHVDFSDEAFAGNLSGVAMRYKLMAIENKSKTLETKYKTALRHQFKILASAWAKKSIDINYLDVFFDFKRNIPVNLLDEAQISAALKGLVSERTRLSLLSFVDDVDYELEQMKMDSEALNSAPNLDDPNAYSEDEETGSTQQTNKQSNKDEDVNE